MTPPRVPGKRVVYIGGRPVVLSEKEWRDLAGGILKESKRVQDALIEHLSGKKRAKKGKRGGNKV